MEMKLKLSLSLSKGKRFSVTSKEDSMRVEKHMFQKIRLLLFNCMGAMSIHLVDYSL